MQANKITADHVKQALKAADAQQLAAYVAAGANLDEILLVCWHGLDNYGCPNDFHLLPPGQTCQRNDPPIMAMQRSTLLINAILSHSPGQVELLLRYGANPNLRSDINSPLELATTLLPTFSRAEGNCNNSLRMIKLLLNAGATTEEGPLDKEGNPKNGFEYGGSFALHLAILWANEEAATAIAIATPSEIVRATLLNTMERRGLIESTTSNIHPVHGSSTQNHKMRLIIDKLHNYLLATTYFNAMINDAYLFDVLHYAKVSLFGPYRNPQQSLGLVNDISLSMAGEELKNNIDAALRFVEVYKCRLILAVRKNDFAKVQQLLQEGVDLTTQDWHGATALQYADTKRFREIKQLLSTAADSSSSISRVGLFQAAAPRDEQIAASFSAPQLT